jgi:hypothetical protein
VPADDHSGRNHLAIFRSSPAFAHSAAGIDIQEVAMRFDVTPDALDTAAQQIRQQADTLGRTPSAASLHTVPAVKGALELVDDLLRADMNSARRSLGTITEALTSAATTYRSNEDALALATQVAP